MSALVVQPHSSAMLPASGPLYWLSGLPWFMRRLRMEDHSAERVRLAAERGPIVYVLHTRSHVDWLALQSVLNERRLPLPAFTAGHTPWANPHVHAGSHHLVHSTSAKSADPSPLSDLPESPRSDRTVQSTASSPNRHNERQVARVNSELSPTRAR